MPRDPAVLIEDMLTALLRIESYTDGFIADRIEDPRTLDAVIRNLEVLGEAAKGIPESARINMPRVEWRKITGLRDVLSHQYFGIDASIVADVIVHKLPGIKSDLEAYLSSR
ncbi:MAG TPA: DUF86 domain-containing protein [Kiritimatiellia bacterium]|nr:DUF86 domain-containing protein [Kiritimatiellia bacterium]